MFWERKKGSKPFHPEGLRFAKLFEVIRDAVVAADAKAQHIVRWSWVAICELEAMQLLALDKLILHCVNTGGKR